MYGTDGRTDKTGVMRRIGWPHNNRERAKFAIINRSLFGNIEIKRKRTQSKIRVNT